MIDCRPKDHQTTSNASSSLHMSFFPSQWPKQTFSASMGDSRWEISTPEKVVVEVF